MINHEELETLAAVIYNEVCRVFREQSGQADPQTTVPFALQTEAVKTAYISGARAANTYIINAMVRHTTEV